MAKPERKAWNVGTRGAWLSIDGKRVQIESVDLNTGVIRLAGANPFDAVIYEPPIEYNDPYPEERE